MADFYANPYDTSASGFYFDSLDDMERKYAASRAEEFEIDFMDGTPAESSLWQMIGPLGMPDMKTWFDTLEDLDDHEMAAVGFLMGDLNVPLETALETRDEPIMRTGSAEDAVAEYVEEIGGPGNITNPEFYFDYEGFGRDVRIEGGDQMHLQEVIDDAEGSDDEDEIEDAKGAQEEIDRLDRLTDQELGVEIVDEVYGGLEEVGPEFVSRYFDYAKLARDMGYNSELAEFRFAGENYVVMNAAGLG